MALPGFVSYFPVFLSLPPTWCFLPAGPRLGQAAVTRGKETQSGPNALECRVSGPSVVEPAPSVMLTPLSAS